ncbi:hypothetical protein HPB49_025975 [Dermacentor silvarum]|nr:hypothetical protein HPB49_025975 [Dermacentor silvarum]
MSRAIFPYWLKGFNEDVKHQGRQICLLLDNCSAHHVDGLQLLNIELIFCPLNYASLIQPLDKGIINRFKCCYCHRVMDKIMLNIRFERQTKINIYQAIEMLAASWQEVGAQTVSNCFTKAQIEVVQAGFCDDKEEPENPPDVPKVWDALRANGGLLTTLNLMYFCMLKMALYVLKKCKMRRLLKPCKIAVIRKVHQRQICCLPCLP